MKRFMNTPVIKIDFPFNILIFFKKYDHYQQNKCGENEYHFNLAWSINADIYKTSQSQFKFFQKKNSK